jgi:AcrR family transcriptional regulator
MSEANETADAAAQGVVVRPSGRAEVIEASLHAAADLFAEHNPSQVSVREIAKNAGVSHALVHRYLGSKNDILLATLSWERQRMLDSFGDAEKLADAPSTFEPGYPADRYLKTILRARIEGFELPDADDEFEVSRKILDLMAHSPVDSHEGEPGFDPRLVLAVVTAASAGMSLASDFFFASAGDRESDLGVSHEEYDRLMRRILSLAEKPAPL